MHILQLYPDTDLDIVTDLTPGRGGPFHSATLIDHVHRDRRDTDEVGVEVLCGDPAGDLMAAYRNLRDHVAMRYGQERKGRQEEQLQRWREEDARRAADTQKEIERVGQPEEEAQFAEAQEEERSSWELGEDIVSNPRGSRPATSEVNEGGQGEQQQENRPQQVEKPPQEAKLQVGVGPQHEAQLQRGEEPQQDTGPQQEDEQHSTRRSMRRRKQPDAAKQTANGTTSKSEEKPQGKQKRPGWYYSDEET